MASISAVKNIIYTSLARDSTDPAAVLVLPYAINWAIRAAAVMFRPPEMWEFNTVTINPGVGYTALSYDWIDIQRLVDSDGKDLYFVPFESFRMLAPRSSTNPRYFTLFGKVLIVSGTMASSTSFTLYWLKLPDWISADGASIPFDGHDAFIVSLATAICQAVFEEGENVDIWSKIGEIAGMTGIQRTKMQEVMQGIPSSLEAKITGTLAGGK